MSYTTQRLAVVAVLAVALAALLPAAASAHQTGYGNNTSVTMHIAPEDEPVADEVSTITVTSVRPRRGTFAWATCRCRIKITNSAGSVLVNRAFKRRTTYTFPSAGAYRTTLSGRYRRSGAWRTFAVSLSWRAS